MVGYAHAPNIERLRPNLSFLAGGLHLPWVTMVFLTGFIIEAMLAGRLWLQLNNEDADATGLKALLISVTDALVAPFDSYGSTFVTERSSGVFEFSTLVAVEAYLLGTLAIVLAIVAIRFMSFFTEQAVAVRRRHELRARSKITMQRRAPGPVRNAHGPVAAVAQTVTDTPTYESVPATDTEPSVSTETELEPARADAPAASRHKTTSVPQHAEVAQ